MPSWVGSRYDALNAGTMDLTRLERLVAAYPLEPQTTWYAVDASVWPRCDAETSPERGYSHHRYQHSHGQPIVAGWNYSWLVQLPSRCASWTAPLRVRRIIPGENFNAVAAAQIRSWLEQAPPATALPIFTCDAGYEPIPLTQALAGQQVGLLVRLRAGRCFYADPTSQPPTGRPRRHGATFVCADPATWPAPTDTWTATGPQYAQVTLRAWADLHAVPHLHATRGARRPRPVVRGTVLRREVERLPRPTKPPQPLWFWWSGALPPDLAEVWRAYTARFSIEHTFRFFKQTLGWTTPKLRSPALTRAHPPLPIGGPGCSSWPTSRCAWRATRSAMCAYPGNRPCRPSGGLLPACVGAFRTSWHSWALPLARQNPVDARRDAPVARAHRLLHASPQSN